MAGGPLYLKVEVDAIRAFVSQVNNYCVLAGRNCPEKTQKLKELVHIVQEALDEHERGIRPRDITSVRNKFYDMNSKFLGIYREVRSFESRDSRERPYGPGRECTTLWEYCESKFKGYAEWERLYKTYMRRKAEGARKERLEVALDMVSRGMPPPSIDEFGTEEDYNVPLADSAPARLPRNVSQSTSISRNHSVSNVLNGCTAVEIGPHSDGNHANLSSRGRFGGVTSRVDHQIGRTSFEGVRPEVVRRRNTMYEQQQVSTPRSSPLPEGRTSSKRKHTVLDENEISNALVQDVTHGRERRDQTLQATKSFYEGTSVQKTKRTQVEEQMNNLEERRDSIQEQMVEIEKRKVDIEERRVNAHIESEKKRARFLEVRQAIMEEIYKQIMSYIDTLPPEKKVAILAELFKCINTMST